ncbi:MAG: hypothetical protein ACF8XB_19315 [Planctomycetota bacterium JB042]
MADRVAGLLVAALVAGGCAAEPSPLIEEARGPVRFEGTRLLLPAPTDGRTPARPRDPREAERGRLRAVGTGSGTVVLLRADRDPPTTAARVALGDGAVVALAFGDGEAARHLYVALDDRRLVTIDLEADGGPAVVDTLVTRDALGLAADAERLVLLTDEPRRRVLRFDLWDPARPRIDGSIAVGRADGVAIEDGRLVLFDDGGPARLYRFAGGSGTVTVHQSVNQ